VILLNNPPFLETPSACLKTAQQISPTNGVQTILILGEGVLMVFLGVDLWPVGVLQQNQKWATQPVAALGNTDTVAIARRCGRRTGQLTLELFSVLFV
jgi:hypothetical protein